MDFDNYGNLYIPEFAMNRIRSFDNVILEGIAKNPMAVHVRGNILYIADTGNHRILAYDLNTGNYDVVAGIGRPGYTQ